MGKTKRTKPDSYTPARGPFAAHAGRKTMNPMLSDAENRAVSQDRELNGLGASLSGSGKKKKSKSSANTVSKGRGFERGSAAGFSLQDASQARRDATAAHRTGQQRGTRVQGGRGIGGRGDTAMAAPSGDYGNLEEDANTKKMLAVCVVFLVIVTGIMIFVASQHDLFGGETTTEVGVGAG